MNTNKEDMRELAAQLYALVICTMTGNELQLAVRNLIKISKDNHVNPSRLQSIFYFLISFSRLDKYIFCAWDLQSPETQHGAILALGYMVGRYMSRKKLVTLSDSAQNKGQQLKLPSLEDDQLVPMATKTIGMESILLSIACNK